MDPGFEGNRAWGLLRSGRYDEAVQIFRQVCAETHIIDQEYDRMARGLAQGLTQLGRRREAAYVHLYLHEFEATRGLLEAEHPLDEARVLEQQGAWPAAAQRYLARQRYVLAAIAYERAKTTDEARQCWERALADGRVTRAPYVEALVHFNLAYCCLAGGDDAGNTHLVNAQRLLEEVADEFETSGQRERAFDCYQILLEMGKRSGAFENLAEGYLNCIRILKEDNLKYYVLQYYEDFLREAVGHQELHAAASLYREAADYCLRMGLIYDRHYLKSAAETWLQVAEKNTREGGPAELSENAYLAAVACFNTLGEYQMVGEAYRRLCKIGLAARVQKRYEKIAERYSDAKQQAVEAPPFPNYLRQPHAYPEIWYMDVVEWDHDGDVVAVCASVVGDTSYPDVVRRRALIVLLDCLEEEAAHPGIDVLSMETTRLARVAERLGDLQIYVVLRPLERLFDHADVRVQRGVMRALRFLFFKRSFGLLNRGLASSDDGVRQGALEALGRLYFNHAFDPLVRIFRETEDGTIKATALESIGRIPTLEAGDFLIEVLRYEPEPLRGLARRLLVSFENRDLIPILRQHYQMESGPLREELEYILRQVGGMY
jgi:tetratricopeptide (TPR) repeat protein